MRFSFDLPLADHDESTYKSDETAAKRWIMNDSASFYNKGKGPSIMFRIFNYASQWSIFWLTDKEYVRVLKKYPELNIDSDVSCEENSTSASINLGGEIYFNNQNILTSNVYFNY